MSLKSVRNCLRYFANQPTNQQMNADITCSEEVISHYWNHSVWLFDLRNKLIKSLDTVTLAKPVMWQPTFTCLFWTKWLQKLWMDFNYIFMRPNVDNGSRNRWLHFSDVPDSKGTLAFDHPKIGQATMLCGLVKGKTDLHLWSSERL